MKVSSCKAHNVMSKRNNQLDGTVLTYGDVCVYVVMLWVTLVQSEIPRRVDAPMQITR